MNCVLDAHSRFSQRLINCCADTLVIHEAECTIPLGIEVDEQSLVLLVSKCGGEINRGGGLADSSLLVGNGQNHSDFTRSGKGTVYGLWFLEKAKGNSHGRTYTV